jgi:hypothetical protein
LLVEDDGLDDELNVGRGARRGGASAGGFVETERDRLIRTVRGRQRLASWQDLSRWTTLQQGAELSTAVCLRVAVTLSVISAD